MKSLHCFLRVAVLGLGLTALSNAQAPPPGGDSAGGSTATTVAHLLSVGRTLLEREDPLPALSAFRGIAAVDSASAEAFVGLGRSHLLLGRPEIARRYADAALAIDPEQDAALALRVRALLRARRFQEALTVAQQAVRRGHDGPELLAAHASALFRMQRIDEAAVVYRHVVAADPLHAEAHLRLGSGLTPPCEITVGDGFHRGVRAAREGRFEVALALFRKELAQSPHNPIVHRMIGETLYARRAVASLVSTADEFRTLEVLMPGHRVDSELAARFMPDFPALSGDRRRVALRALALFHSRLPRLVALHGRHDLMAEAERTTDDPSRAALRGKRTFDGRVWDDVRGIGGLRAATGIEALDEAAAFGFDTLAHEIAHQVHLHGFGRRSIEMRIRELYGRAVAEGRCLDYYAATNHAEYFGQGVEAFVSLAKRPTLEATHGHTRFELLRTDPALHDLIASLVDYDPLDARRDPARRTALLAAAVEAALRSGRAADAVTAAELVPDETRRAALLARARHAALRARSL